MSKRGLGVLVVSTVMLAGCGGGPSDLLELKEAAVDAGLACPDWQRSTDTAPGTEFGSCAAETTLIWYDDEDARDAGVKTLTSMGVPFTLLVGDRWVVNSPDAADLRDSLGGDLLTNLD